MKLNDPLIDSFEFEGEVYPLNLAFNRVLDVYDVIRDDVLSEYEKAKLSLLILVGIEFTDFLQVINIWGYLKNRFLDFSSSEKQQYDRLGNPMPVAKNEDDRRLIDFEKDAEYIYASFLQAYGFSLFDKQDELSWMEFKALLNALPDNTIMQQIISIRKWKPSDGGNKKQMFALQAVYALEDDREEE